MAAMLVAATFLIYMPCWHGDWVWDDQMHLLNNPVLKPGGLAKAWVPGGYLNYWPLTYTVYWIQFQLWDLHPLGFHLVNIAFHAIAALLVWRVLSQLRVPGALFAAAIFALHPVNVESVAWVAQLKGVLSLVLALTSLILYLSAERNESRWRYLAALAAFVLSALAKGEAITLPLVLLALAWWQRGRISRRDVLRVLPYFLIAACMAAVEIWSQHALDSQTVRTDDIFSRTVIAGCAVWFYLGKLVWPVNLSAIYPYWTIDESSFISYLPGAMLLFALAAAWRRRHSWGRPVVMLIVCYVALLLPVLGFVNITFMARSLVADHWQYIAMIVPCAFAAAAYASLAGRFWRRSIALLGCLAVLVALSVLSWRQSRLYGDPELLYEATIAKNPNCSLAEFNLGSVLAARGEPDSAILHYQRALQLKPDYADAESSLGAALAGQDKLDSAIRHFERSLEIDPNSAQGHCDLGTALARQRKFDQAIKQLDRALQLNPNIPGANYNLALAMANRGDFDQAIAHLKRELEIKPDFELARQTLAAAIADRERLGKALQEGLEELQRRPNDVNLLNEMAWTLATDPNASIRNGSHSVKLAEWEWKITGGDDPRALDTLAAAYAEAGRFDEAIVAAEKGHRLAQAVGNDPLAAQIATCLVQYRLGKAFRDIRH